MKISWSKTSGEFLCDVHNELCGWTCYADKKRNGKQGIVEFVHVFIARMCKNCFCRRFGG